MGHERWAPSKRLTWHQIDHLRTLRQTLPEEWTVKKLSQSFGISVPAIMRILKSKFEPTPEIKKRQDARAKQQIEEKRAAKSPTTVPSSNNDSNSANLTKDKKK